jgi:arylsulfatase A
MIVSWQNNLAANKTCENPTINIDFYNTFLEMIGQKPNDTLDGKSIWASMKNPTETQSRGEIFWHYPHFSNQLGRPAGAIRVDDWKLVKNYETNKVELYNLKDDVLESKDLSRKNKAKTKELHDLLLKKLSESNAQMPIRK